MNKRSLVVLSICLVLGAGVVGYVWANGCCHSDNLCHGKVLGKIGCRFYFTVEHDRQEEDQHAVKIWIEKDGDPTAVGYMMQIVGDPPYNICVPYDKELTLDADSTYHFYFSCVDCLSRDPNGTDRYTLPTGDCE